MCAYTAPEILIFNHLMVMLLMPDSATMLDCATNDPLPVRVKNVLSSAPFPFCSYGKPPIPF